MKSINHIKFCPDHYQEIENYELAKADNFEGWICHHRNGEEFSKEWLIKNNMYYNRSDPHEFKFVTESEHRRIKHPNTGLSYGMLGKHHSDETKHKISTSNTGTIRDISEDDRIRRSNQMKLINSNKDYYGKNNPFFGKHHSDETKEIMSKYKKGRHWRVENDKRKWYD